VQSIVGNFVEVREAIELYKAKTTRVQHTTITLKFTNASALDVEELGDLGITYPYLLVSPGCLSM